MPFYIRESVSAGPFRFNFSKSGVGVSVGVKGLRFGTGPRGHYVHAGANGIYYRSTLGGKRPSKLGGNAIAGTNDFSIPVVKSTRDADMIRVSSSDVRQMRDERFSEILDDLGRELINGIPKAA